MRRTQVNRLKHDRDTNIRSLAIACGDHAEASRGAHDGREARAVTTALFKSPDAKWICKAVGALQIFSVWSLYFTDSPMLDYLSAHDASCRREMYSSSPVDGPNSTCTADSEDVHGLARIPMQQP